MDQPNALPLSARILNLLADRGPLKARDIAEQLEESLAEVNRTLFGVLYGKVAQDRAYRWSVVRRSSHSDAAVPASASATPLARLSRYYLDCLSQDAEQGCSVFAQGRPGSEDYAVLADLPELRARATWSTQLSEQARALVQRSRQDKSSVLFFGYPTILRYHRTAKWEGFFVEPLMLYALDVGEGGVLQVADDLPTLNFKPTQKTQRGRMLVTSQTRSGPSVTKPSHAPVRPTTDSVARLTYETVAAAGHELRCRVAVADRQITIGARLDHHGPCVAADGGEEHLDRRSDPDPRVVVPRVGDAAQDRRVRGPCQLLHEVLEALGDVARSEHRLAHVDEAEHVARG